MANKTLKGLLLANTAGVCWGSMGVAAQYLMREAQFGVLDLTSIRLLGAGLLLVILDIALHGTQNTRRVFQKENLRDIAIYGLVLLSAQGTFFLSINAANAATATILVLLAPLFVIAYMALFKHHKITPLEAISLALALIGVLLIVTKGDFQSINLSAWGVVWGLVSAFFAAVGTLQPAQAVRRLSVFPVIGWAMTFSGALTCLINNPFETNVIWDTMSILCYLHVVVFGTITAFCCYLKSLEFIVPSTAAMLTCTEPLSAVILSVIIWGATFSAIEIAGALCILSTVVLLSRTK